MPTLRTPSPSLSRGAWSLARLTCVAALVALAACGGDGSMGPSDRINASDEELAAVSAALIDARDRIVPSLHTTEIINPLQDELTLLSNHLLARRRSMVSQTLLTTRRYLTQSEPAAPPEDGPDRTAIHLALDQVVLLLNR